MPSDTNAIKKLTPSPARKLVAKHNGSLLSLNGLTRLDALTAIDAETGKALAEFSGTLGITFDSIGDAIPLNAGTARLVIASKQHAVSLPGITAFETRDSVLVAQALATRKGPLSLPNLRRISPRTLSLLVVNEGIAIPPIETLELIPEPDGSATEDLLLPGRFQQRRR